MVVTFYSFKGGVGRSMALANVGHWFALRGARVILIDWDLEAPGLENYFFDDSATIDEIRSRPGVIDMLYTYQRQWHALGLTENHNEDEVVAAIERSVAPPTDYLFHMQHYAYPSQGSISLLPAGRRGTQDLDDYAGAVQRFDWGAFYERYRGQCYFEWFRQRLCRPDVADIILVDSRTGVTEMGGVCTRQLADVVVCLCAPNRGNLEGVMTMSRTFVDEELLDARKHRPISAVIVPARVENSERDQRNTFKREFTRVTSASVPQALAIPDAFWRLRIPYIPYYAYRETLAVRTRGADEDLEEAYNRVALAIAVLSPAGSKLHDLCAADIAESVFGHNATAAALHSDHALNDRLNEVWDDLDDVARAKVMTVLSRALRIVGESDTATTIRSGSTPLTAEEARLLEPFVALGVLTLNSGNGALQYLDAPESVEIGRWPFVRDWLAERENLELMLTRQAVSDAMRKWQRSEKNDAALLQGLLLKDVQDAVAAHADAFNAEEREFVSASVVQAQTELSRVASQERALADAAARVRRMRVLTAAAASLLILVTVGIWLLLQYGPPGIQVWQIKRQSPSLVGMVSGKARNKIILDWAKALVVAGDVEPARIAISALEDPVERARGLGTLAGALWLNARPQEAQQAFDESMRTLKAQPTVNHEWFIELGEHAAQAQQFALTKLAADEALSVHDSNAGDGTPEGLAAARLRMTRLYLLCKDWQMATKLLTEAGRTATTIEQPYARAVALSEVAEVANSSNSPVQAEDAAALALKAIAEISDPTTRARVMGELGASIVRSAPSMLQATLAGLPDTLFRSDSATRAQLSGHRTLILAIAGTEADARAESDRFLRLAIEVTDPAERVETLRSTIERLAQTGLTDLAHRLALELRLMAIQLERSSNAMPGVREAVHSARLVAGRVLASHGGYDEAIENARSLATPEERSLALAEVASILLQGKQIERAAQAADGAARAAREIGELPVSDPQSTALRTQAQLVAADILVQLNRRDDAAALLDQVYRSSRRPDGTMASSINAAALSRSFARVGAFRQAKEVADRADSNDRLVGYSVILMEYALLSNSGMRSVGS